MSSKVLVDTCVVSYIFKNDSRAPAYTTQLAGFNLYMSFMTLAELYRWPIHSQWGKARTIRLKEKINEYTILPYNDEVCWQWARVKAFKGRPSKDADAWIAATALAFSLPLATHNVADFTHLSDLDLIYIDGATQ